MMRSSLPWKTREAAFKITDENNKIVGKFTLTKHELVIKFVIQLVNFRSIVITFMHRIVNVTNVYTVTVL